MPRYVLDTNVYIEAMRDAAARAALETWQRRMAPHVWQHAVVAAELLAGAADDTVRRRWHARWVAPAERVRRVITPGYGTWLRATRILVRLRSDGHIAGRVAPGFLNDCLIAATAREFGHAVVTHNRRHFEIVGRVEDGLEVVAPLP